jgi:excisionase family DNA binding protein
VTDVTADTVQRDHYYTAAEVAAIIRRTPSSVRQLCIEGKIPATKPAGTWLIPIDQFATWLRSGANEALEASA